jgi:DNA-binding IclR family transcriptional regulator
MAKKQAPLLTPGAPARPQPGAERLPVRAIKRAFDLLAALDGPPATRTLSAIARNVDLPISTAARILATLEQTGLVRREFGGQYAPGIRLLQIGLSALKATNVYELSEPHLRHLSEASGETANLAVRADAANAIYLRQVVSDNPVHHASWLGLLLPINKTAVGDALAGKTNAQGYFARRDTFAAGVTAVAAPVYGAGGGVVAAFSITGPSFRMSERDLKRFGIMVSAQARAASAELGAPNATTPPAIVRPV